MFLSCLGLVAAHIKLIYGEINSAPTQYCSIFFDSTFDALLKFIIVIVVVSFAYHDSVNISTMLLIFNIFTTITSGNREFALTITAGVTLKAWKLFICFGFVF